jgi:hypothetical protein
MSFGYAVGDAIAVLNLAERIAEEIKAYRDAPRHFQRLSAELNILRSTIQNVLDIQIASPIDLPNLNRIRAIAMHCHQPLQAFVTKMQSSEASLGHYRTTRTISAVG